MKKSTILSVGLLLVAGSALASNTGFKLNYTLSHVTGKSGNNWISVPYFYFPDGNVANNNQTALNFCDDLNETLPPAARTGAKVATIFRFNSPTDKAISQSCIASFSVYPLKKGEGYSLVPPVDNVVVNIVGSHDDTYAKNKVVPPATPTLYVLSHVPGKSGNNWFSVPYHAKPDNALDVCDELNNTIAPTPRTGAKVATVFRFNSPTDKAISQSCIASFSVFTPKAGEGLSLVPPTDGIGVSVSVY